MSANQIKVRPKETVKPNWSKYYLLFAAASVVLVGIVGFLVFTNFSGVFGFSSNNFEVISENGRNRFRVPASGNLQGAIDRAKGGDIIELEAGAIYYEVTLPKKNITEFITIESSAVSQLPENQRITANQSKLLAKIITRGGGKSAVTTADGAHHYRFVGIEFAPLNKDYIYNLVYLGTETEKLENVPHDFEFDRCYFHSIKEGVTRRGLALNAQNVVVKNSYFQGFVYPQEETQGICGWSGTKNVKIINNYIEGGAENIMFGGSDPTSPEHIPQDIEVRGNHFNKPANWRGKFTVKCLFELKNAKRVQFIENYLENNWEGSAFRITVRNQDGNAPFSTIEDVVIKNNIINGAGEGINILGKDDTYPSQVLKNLTITNNLFLKIGEKEFAGSGYFIQITNGENILISNNTVFNQGNITTFYGEMPKNFRFWDNIVGHGNYGIAGLTDVKSVASQKLFQNNVIVNNRKVNSDDTSFPANNFWISDYQSVGFVNLLQNDFNLALTSRFRGKGLEKNDIGCKINQIPNNSLKMILK
jgi:hypothetical protein